MKGASYHELITLLQIRIDTGEILDLSVMQIR